MPDNAAEIAVLRARNGVEYPLQFTPPDAAGRVSPIVSGRPWWLDDPTLTVTRVQSSAGGAATCTLTAPGAGYRRRVVRVDAGYDADPAGGRLTITSDPAGTPVVLYSVPVTKSGPAPLPDLCVAGETNKAVSVVLAAGGGSILADVNVWSVTEAV